MRQARMRGWGETTLEAALYDADDDDAVNAAIVDFSRAGLRASWRVGHGIGGSFGPLACQQNTRSGTLLRSALRQAATSLPTGSAGGLITRIRGDYMHAIPPPTPEEIHTWGWEMGVEAGRRLAVEPARLGASAQLLSDSPALNAAVSLLALGATLTQRT